jgi:hypothetical protein
MSLFKKRPSYGFVPAGNVRMSGRLGKDNRPGYERHQGLEKLLRIFRPSLLEQWRHHSLHFGEMRGNPCPDLRLVSLRAELGQCLDKGTATEAWILDGQFKRIEDRQQFCRRRPRGVAGKLRDEALPLLFLLGEVLCDQMGFGSEMPVKGHLRHAAFLNNPVYADGMNPVPVEEFSRCPQNAVSGRDAISLAGSLEFPA